MIMELETFIRRFRPIASQMVVKQNGRIRCKDGRCPVEVIAGSMNGDTRAACLSLGLTEYQTNMLMDALDNHVTQQRTAVLRGKIIGIAQFGGKNV